MNRAAVVAILLAAGAVACAPIAEPVPPSLTLYWRFVGSQGQAYGDGTQRAPGCVGANVDQVHMSVVGPGGFVVDDFTYPCLYQGVPGIFYEPLAGGTYRWSIEGIRLGLTVFYAQGTTDVFGPVVLTVPLAADFPDVNLTYQLPAGVTCASNFTGFPLGQIDFSILTTIPPIVEEYSATNLVVTCQDPPNNWFTAPSVAPGTYHMRYIAALTPTTNPPSAAYQECAVPFVHQDLPNSVDNVPFYLVRATGSCP